MTQRNVAALVFVIAMLASCGGSSRGTTTDDPDAKFWTDFIQEAYVDCYTARWGWDREGVQAELVYRPDPRGLRVGTFGDYFQVVGEVDVLIKGLTLTFVVARQEYPGRPVAWPGVDFNSSDRFTDTFGRIEAANCSKWRDGEWLG